MTQPSILFVHAHPDDEALWTGGTTIRARRNGARVRVVTCTWSPGTPRFDELRQSLSLLDAGDPHPLCYADGGFPESAPERPALQTADFDDTVNDLVAEIRDFRPDIVITYDAFGVYGHPDHIRTHRITLSAVEAATVGPIHTDSGAPWQVRSLYLVTVPRSLSNKTWIRVTGSPPSNPELLPGTDDDGIDVHIDITDVFDIKWAALTSHASEMQRSSTLRMLLDLNPDERKDFIGTECYVRRDLIPPGADLPVY